MKFFKVLILLLLLCSVIYIPVFGENSKIGTSTSIFLKMEQGARAVGMGGAFVAVSNDVNSTFWNPAGLTSVTSHEVTATHTQWFEDINSEFIAYAQPLSNIGAIGASLVYMSSDNIEKRDTAGNIAGDFDVKNFVFGVSYAHLMLENLSLGTTFKGIREEYGSYTVNGVCADIGVLFAPLRNVSLGLNLQNLGPRLKIGSTKEKLPLNIKSGMSYNPVESITLAFDVDLPRDNDVKLHSGIEFWYKDMIALRLGYEDIGNLGSMSGFTAGCGFKGYESEQFNNVLLQFDYAFLNFGDFDYTHRFSLTVQF